MLLCDTIGPARAFIRIIIIVIYDGNNNNLNGRVCVCNALGKSDVKYY